MITLDRDITLFLNSFNNSFFDIFFYIITGTLIWIPLYIVLFVCIVYRFKKIYKIGLFILCISLGIIISDRVSSGIIKPYFKRLRPSHNKEINKNIHTVNGYLGGKYGFVSSHASNTFFLASFFSLAIFKRKKYLGFLLFFWAALVSYSRIYLGVHYFGDILFGAILGIIISFIINLIYEYVYIKLDKRKISL